MRSGSRRHPSLGQRRVPAPRDDGRGAPGNMAALLGAAAAQADQRVGDRQDHLGGLARRARNCERPTAATPRSLPPRLLSSRTNPPGTPHDEN
jgi:hypothetical protein